MKDKIFNIMTSAILSLLLTVLTVFSSIFVVCAIVHVIPVFAITLFVITYVFFFKAMYRFFKNQDEYDSGQTQ